MNQYSKFTESFWEFRLSEMVMLLVVILLNLGFYVANTYVFPSDMTAGLNGAIFPVVPFTMLMGYIFFIIEHKTEITLNKDTNSFVVMEKMLFFDKYKVNRKYKLEDIISAEVITHYDRDREHGTSITYNVLINTKMYGAFELFKSSSGNQLKYTNIVIKINSFLNSEQRYLSLNDNPFIFRCVSVVPFVIALFTVFNTYR